MKIEICLPVKNESASLANNLNRLFFYLKKNFSQLDWQIAVVVNGSSDNSYEVCQQQVELLGNKVSCQLRVQPGKGGAIKSAWKNSEADILIFMDADLSVPLTCLPDLIYPLINNQADLVIGSRFLDNSVVTRSWQRSLVSRGYIFLTKLFLKFQQTDFQCGFKGIKKSSYNKIKDLLKDNNWFFDTELIAFTRVGNLNILEVPVVWQENRKIGEKSRVKLLRDSFYFLKKLIFFRYRLKKIKKY